MSETRLRARLDEAVRAIDAPDVVFAVSHQGRRVVSHGGTAPPRGVTRETLRYEIGSASKTFTGLLLAQLVLGDGLGLHDPVVPHLAPGTDPGPDPVTPLHLITHTSGLSALPADFYPQAVRRWSTNPYERYPAERVVDAFLRARPHRRPGARWRYSNFGAAVLGHTLTAATGLPWEHLLTDRVLRPLGLTGTAASPGGPGTDATGHGKDGVRAVPPLRIGGFQAAGAVRATPHDLLTFLEAHLRPETAPLTQALYAVRRPTLRRGYRRRHEHTLTWFRHPSPRGPFCFHSGATSGQQAFIGFRPETGTAVAAVATRRFTRADGFTAAAYGLLADGV